MAGDDGERGGPRRPRTTVYLVAALVAFSVVSGLVVSFVVGAGGEVELTYVAERPPLTSADSTCYDAPPPADVPEPDPAAAGGIAFTDVTRDAGLCLTHSEPRLPPDCLFTEREDVPGANRESAALIYLRCSEDRMSGGVAVADFDGDGDHDLVMTRLWAPMALWRNDGDGTFTEVAAEAGVDGPQATNGAAWVDVDGDGDQDLVVTTLADDQMYLFVNQGDGTFVDEAAARGVALADGAERRSFSVAAGDFDRDGWADLHLTEWRAFTWWDQSPQPHARLLRNRGAEAPGTFEDVTESAGVVLGDPDTVRPQVFAQDLQPGTYRSASFGSAFVDLDGDGWQDLAVVSDFGTSQLFWNDGDGTFTDGTLDAAVAKEGNAMGSAFGDYDLDGDLDWFVTAIHPQPGGSEGSAVHVYTGNKLYRNEGDRTFTDVTGRAGVADGAWGWGASFADVDRDGLVDLVMTNGMFGGTFHPFVGTEDFTDTPMRFWRNQGDGTFEEMSGPAGLVSRADGKGLATFDLEGDGDLDVVVVNNGQYPTLYRNDSVVDGQGVTVDVVGTDSQIDGLGAIVTVTDAEGRVHRREIGAGAAFLADEPATVHVGVGAGDGPVRVEVRFPATGRTVVVDGVRPGERVEAVEPAA